MARLLSGHGKLNAARTSLGPPADPGLRVTGHSAAKVTVIRRRPEFFAARSGGLHRRWHQGGRDADGDTVYEMKTGYLFLGIRNPTPRQQTMIDNTRRRWQRHAARQQLVADMCGYDLVWYFTNEAARAFADGIIQRRSVRVSFRCDGDRPF